MKKQLSIIKIGGNLIEDSEQLSEVLPIQICQRVSVCSDSHEPPERPRYAR